MIYTSYFSHLKSILEFRPDITPFSIARSQPTGFSLRSIPSLFPLLSTLSRYKHGFIGAGEYTKIYYSTVLAKTSFEEIDNLASDDILLLCWEGRNKFCHRHLVSEWPNKAGHECKELVMENQLSLF